MVRRTDRVLSVSEFFATVPRSFLRSGIVDGAAFWSALAEPLAEDTTLYQAGLEPPEVRYPLDGRNRRFGRTGLPPILTVTLPHLVDDPDSLFAELEPLVRARPEAPVTDHVSWLLRTLAARQGAQVVVERSGGSLDYVDTMTRVVPGAHLIHLYRDGRDCAMSMAAHPRYRMAIIRGELLRRLGFDPYEPRAARSDNAAAEEAAGPMRGLLPHTFSRAAYDAYRIPPARFGLMWSKMVLTGLSALREHDNVLDIDYTDLVQRPRPHLQRLARLFDIPAPSRWMDDAISLIRPGTSRPPLTGAEREELTDACRPGMNRLYGQGRW